MGFPMENAVQHRSFETDGQAIFSAKEVKPDHLQ